MIRDIIVVMGFTLTTSLVGFNIILLYDKENYLKAMEKIGLSYLFGIALISIELFALGLMGMGFTKQNILIPWIPLILFNLYRYKKLSLASNIRIFKRLNFSLLEKTMVFLIVLAVFYAFFKALIKPMESYDAVAIWGLLAKILYFAGTLPQNFFAKLSTGFNGLHPDSPLLLPFSETWFYIFNNGFNDLLVKAIFPISLTAFLMVFYSFLKRAISNRTLALIFTFALVSIKQFNDYAANGYADIPMAIYCSLTFLSLYLWVNENKEVYFWTAFLACISAIWTKSEGGAIFLTMIALVLFYQFSYAGKRNRLFGRIWFALAFMTLIFMSWVIFKNILGISSVIFNDRTFKGYNYAGIVKRVQIILYEYQRQFFGLKHWNLSWIAFIFFIFAGYKKIMSKDRFYIVAPIFIILSSYSAIYLVTPLDVSWHVRTSASRIFLHILPLVIFYLAIRTKEIYGASGRDKGA